MHHLSTLIKKTMVVAFVAIVFISYLSLSNSAFAQGSTEYRTLAPIQTNTTTFVGQTVDTTNLNDYLNNMFKLGVAVAGALAVVMIILGGIEYMSTDAIGKKEDGKKRIGAAVTGLIVALGSYMLLNTLSPDFLNTNLKLSNLQIEDLDSGPGDGKLVYQEDKTGVHYDYYDNGVIQAKYPDGTVQNYDNENDNQPPPMPKTPINSDDLNKYKTAGCVPAVDHSGRHGFITPSAAYMKDNLPKFFPGTEVMSDYRSPEHNRSKSVGGAKGSAHLRGAAIDIADGNENMNTALGLSIVEWGKQHGQELGLTQIIFQDKFYNSPDGGKTWVTKGGATGHYNHVHLGGSGNCN